MRPFVLQGTAFMPYGPGLNEVELLSCLLWIMRYRLRPRVAHHARSSSLHVTSFAPQPTHKAPIYSTIEVQICI